MIFVIMYIYILLSYSYPILLLSTLMMMMMMMMMLFLPDRASEYGYQQSCSDPALGSDAFWGMVDMRATWQRQVVDVPCLEQNLPF